MQAPHRSEPGVDAEAGGVQELACRGPGAACTDEQLVLFATAVLHLGLIHGQSNVDGAAAAVLACQLMGLAMSAFDQRGRSRSIIILMQFFARAWAKAYGQAVLRRQKDTILIDFGKYQTEGLTYLGAWEVGGIEYVEAPESKI